MRIIDQMMMRSVNEPGLEEAFGWLKSFEHTVTESDDAVVVLNSLVQLGVERPDSCDCEKDDDDPVLAWVHAHHAEYNHAVWEIVSQKPGLIDSLRAAIQADIDGPSERLDGRIFGEITARSYARTLLASFIKHKPSTQWIGA